jgi:hypothetical protein
MPSFSPWDAVGGGIGGAFQYAGAKQQADATEKAAKMQTDASNHAADISNAANMRGEQFQREEAQAFARQAEIDRRANYDLQASKLSRLGSIGSLLGLKGLPSMAMPAYVPGVVPDFLKNGPANVGDAVNGTYNFAQPGQAMNLRTPFSPAELATLQARVAAQGGGFAGGRPPGSIGSYLGAS